MMKRDARSRAGCLFKVGMLQLTSQREENRDGFKVNKSAAALDLDHQVN